MVKIRQIWSHSRPTNLNEARFPSPVVQPRPVMPKSGDFFSASVGPEYVQELWRGQVAVVAVHAADDEPVATGRHDRSWGDEGG